jgi:uncharacterized protein YgiM (DUF1202 family)
MAKILKTLILNSLLLMILLYPLALTAEQVTPSERVKDNINIRSAPSADSPSMGILQEGESLELLGSVPWWHKIKLPNGQPAFVSKAWAKVIPEIQAPSPDSKYTMHVIDSVFDEG